MIKKMCDKCKKDISINPLNNTVFPKYIIYKYDRVIFSQEINLCDSCEKLFEKWLSEEEDEKR